MAAETLDVTSMIPNKFEPKRKNRWILMIEGIDAYIIKTTSRPTISTEEVEVPFINSRRSLRRSTGHGMGPHSLRVGLRARRLRRLLQARHPAQAPRPSRYSRRALGHQRRLHHRSKLRRSHLRRRRPNGSLNDTPFRQLCASVLDIAIRQSQKRLSSIQVKRSVVYYLPWTFHLLTALNVDSTKRLN